MSQPHKRDLKLELTWVGKDNARPRLEPRILVYDDALSHTASARVTDHDQFDNLLIFGDNLLALKALTTDPKYRGQVKCIYIDPPFNTQEMFQHYDDGLEHSYWLGAMRERIEILHSLLDISGSFFIHIDDNELGYVIALCDEIFGRKNRISVITFKQGSATGHKAINPGIVSTTNFIIIYAKDKKFWQPNKIYTVRESRDNRYNQYIINPDEHYSRWQLTTLSKAFAENLGFSTTVVKKSLGDSYEEKLLEFILDNPHRVVRLARPDYNSVGKDVRMAIDSSKENPNIIIRCSRNGFPDIYLKSGERLLFYTDKLKLIDGNYVSGEPLTSLWDDILSNNIHNEGSVEFPKGKKPEGLIKRCIELATNPGDLVLDSFAGSGTTGAVAHKMGRRWVMVELGEHAHTHIIPRMQKVIDGTDAGGITASVGWGGGGGFRYARLAPSLLEKDKWGQYVISKQYNAAMLAEACCKIHGYEYAPSQSEFWRHGQSTESDFIYVTTSYQSTAMLQEISEAVGPDRTLLVLATAYDSAGERLENLTLKKIPQSILRKCDWGHDDYSLNVKNLPSAPQVEGAEPDPAPVAAKRGRKSAASSPPPMLALMTEGGEQ